MLSYGGVQKCGYLPIPSNSQSSKLHHLHMETILKGVGDPNGNPKGSPSKAAAVSGAPVISSDLHLAPAMAPPPPLGAIVFMCPEKPVDHVGSHVGWGNMI